MKVEGVVIALIEVKPGPAIAFRGMADQAPETAIELIGTRVPFRVTSVESNLNQHIDYKIETVEDGRHYKLRVNNKTRRGNYSGYLKFVTDLAQKPEVLIRVSGFMEGEVSVKPQTILVGKLSANQPLRQGRVMVTSNRNKPFKITNIVYDERFITVTQDSLDKEVGYLIDVSPNMSAVPVGSRQQIKLGIETDLAPGERDEVQIHLFNSADQPEAPGVRR